MYVTQTGATADIAFAPLDTEAGRTLTLRLDFGPSYGQQAVQFLGKSCDPGLTVANIQATSKTETPGTPNSDFLQADANNYGTIYLSTGTIIRFPAISALLEIYRGLQTVLIVSVSSRTAHRLLTASSCNAS